MKKEALLNHLKAFDPAIYNLLQEDIQRQRNTLSLVPTVNAMSPITSYLVGSPLAGLGEGCGAHRRNAVEELAQKRAQELFGSDHAIVRLGNIAVASRVVFLGLLQPGDTVLSFNLRKQEHCAGLNYRFENYGIDPEEQKVDWDAVMAMAQELKPRLIIFSPVSYPRIPNYERLAAVARAVGAHLWIDIGQCVGLAAAGLVPSPAALADVVSFPTNDSLRGPDGAILLCKKDVAEQIDAAVVSSGHAAVYANRLAALAFALHAATQPKFRAYGEQVLRNAKALAATLESSGTKLLCGGTETHLVLAAPAPGTDITDAVHVLARIGLQVKLDRIPTMRSEMVLSALRLSTLNPTTRGLKEEDMAAVGRMIARALSGSLSAHEEEELRLALAKLIMDKPIFSEEWINMEAMSSIFFSDADTNEVHAHAASERMNIIRNLFHKG